MVDKIVAFVRRHAVFFALLATLIVIKLVWVAWATRPVGSFEDEKDDILQRVNYLESKVMVHPRRLINTMPSAIGGLFQGEWALYSCSMLAEAEANVAELYPERAPMAPAIIDSLIAIAKSPDLRYYDRAMWGEDPLESLDGDASHVSYLSHLAWMIGNYKRAGGDGRHDALYDSVCGAMNRRILRSPILNIPTYPDEPIYVPDMMVAIVALTDYAKWNNGRYGSTVNQWLDRARKEWIDDATGLLVPYLDADGKIDEPVRGSFAALNCFYLTKIDAEFAREQYDRLKETLVQTWPATGIREYADHHCLLGMDIDSGPIILNLSPSGTAFAIGSATYFGDTDLRSGLLKTAELAGHTVKWNDRRHYILANLALVGEAITLAMRTNH